MGNFAFWLMDWLRKVNDLVGKNVAFCYDVRVPHRGSLRSNFTLVYSIWELLRDFLCLFAIFLSLIFQDVHFYWNGRVHFGFDGGLLFGQGVFRELIFQQGNLVFERFVEISLLFEFLFQIVDFADEPDNFLCSCVIFLAFGALLNDFMRGLRLDTFANWADELVGFRRILIRDFFMGIFFWNFGLSGYSFAQFSV